MCQYVYPQAPVILRQIKASRGASGDKVFATVYDNGVPIIEAPFARVRYQGLDVANSNGALDGTLSW